VCGCYKGLEGGNRGQNSDGELLRGGEWMGEKNTTQSSIYTNKQFPPAVTDQAQPWLRINTPHLTMEDLVIFLP